MQLLSFFEASTPCKDECNFESSHERLSRCFPFRAYYTRSPLGR